MHQIDLMPQKCREVLGRRVWLRRWAGFFTLSVIALSAVVWYVGASGKDLARERNRLAEVRQHRWEQNEEAQTLQAEIKELERHIERHNRLAWPVRVSEVIDTIGGVVPDEVSLLSFTVTQREEKVVSGKVSKKGKKKVYEQRSILITEIEGVSTNDGYVAMLVQGLQSVPLFRSVVLDYARNTMIDELEARTFRITCEVDLSARYRFVPLAEVSDDSQ